MSKLPYTAEQLDIMRYAEAGKNIIIDAIAGAGKTSTIIGIASKLFGKNILQVTYNKHLKNEVRQKIDDQGIANMEVHTYHSLGYKYYSKRCRTDVGLIELLENNLGITLAPMPYYDYIIVDECQDMTNTLFLFMCKFYRDLLYKPKMIFMGDKYQCIYKFKMANSCFLTHADKLWFYPMNYMQLAQYNDSHSIEFVKLGLSVSHRITRQIADFINISMLGYSRMHSNKNGPNVKYLLAENAKDYYNNVDFLAAYINHKINVERTYYASDVMIILPSLNGGSNTPWKKLENLLSINDHKIYIGNEGVEQINGSEVEKKILFTTIHQSKGLGRKLVIAFNFDNSYFQFYNKTGDRNVCPNTFYVAVTRASKELIVVRGYGQYSDDFDFLLFPPKQLRDKYVDFCTAQRAQLNERNSYKIRYKGKEFASFTLCEVEFKNKKLEIERCNRKRVENDTDNKIREFTVTELVRFLDIRVERNVVEIMDKLLIQRKIDSAQCINIANQLEFKYGNENISTLNAMACTNFYFIMNGFKDHVNAMFRPVYEGLASIAETHDSSLKFLYEYEKSIMCDDSLRIDVLVDIMKNDKYTSLTSRQLMKLCALYEFFNTRLLSPYRQIGCEFNWLSMKTLLTASNNLSKILGETSPSSYVLEDNIGLNRKLLISMLNDKWRELGNYPCGKSQSAHFGTCEECLNKMNRAIDNQIRDYGVQSVAICGRSDCINYDMDVRTLYEFKFKEVTTASDLMQLIVYAHLYSNTNNLRLSSKINNKNYPNKFCLYNIRNCDYFEIKTPIDENAIAKIVMTIVEAKIKGDEEINITQLVTNLKGEESKYPFKHNLGLFINYANENRMDRINENEEISLLRRIADHQSLREDINATESESDDGANFEDEVELDDELLSSLRNMSA